MRFIIILVAIALVFFILKKSLQQLISSNSKTRTKPQESMLPCEYCQTHVPASEAVHHAEKSFCKNQHLDAWLKENK